MPDDTEVVPPASKKQLQRSQHRSMPSSLFDEELFFLIDCCYNLLSTKNFLVDYFATFVVFIDLFRLKGLSSAHNGK